MPRPAPPAIPLPTMVHHRQHEMLALSEQTLRVIMVARALAGSARQVDLEGLQGQIGLLCAKALDLPPGETGFAKLELCRVVQGLDALRDTMRSHSA